MSQATLENILRVIFRAASTSVAGELTDQELLERFQSLGEEAVFTVLIQRHGRMVYHVAQRILADSHEAEDVFQATFLVMARRLRFIGGKKSVGGWLHGVAQRIAWKARAKAVNQRRRERERQVMMPDATEAGNLECNEFRGILDAEIGALAEKHRLPLVLCYLEGRSYEEAARELKCPKSTLASRVSKSLDLLRRRLQRRGVELTSAALAISLGEMAQAASTSVLVTANTVKAAALVAVGKSVSKGLVTANALALVKEGIAGMVWMKAVAFVAVAAALALGGVGLAQFVGPPSRGEQKTIGDASKLPVRPDNAGAAPRVDLHGDPLPEGAISRLGTVRFNHGERLNSLVLTPDGNTLVSEGSGKVRVWNAADGKELRAFGIGQSTWDDHCILMPGGERLMTLRQENASDAIRIWSLKDGSEVKSTLLPVRRGGVDVWHRNALAPDGRYCAASLPMKIRVFETATAKELWSMPNAELEKGTIVTFAGSERLVTADHEGMVRIFDAATGKLVREFQHGSKVGVMATTTDGKLLATIEHHDHSIDLSLVKDRVHVWDLTNGKELRTLDAPPRSWFEHVLFSPDGKTLFTSCSIAYIGTKVCRWDVESGKQTAMLGDGYPLAVSVDGRHAVVGVSKFELLDLADNRPVLRSDAKAAWASDVFLSEDGNRVVTHGIGSIGEWDVRTGRRLQTSEIVPYPFSLPSATHSPNGRYVTLFEKDDTALRIPIWDVATKRILYTLKPTGANQNMTFSFSPDSLLLVGYELKDSETGTLTVWNAQTGKEIRSLKLPKSVGPWGGAPRISLDNKTVVMTGRDVVGLEIASGQVLYSWRMPRLPSQFSMKITTKDGKEVPQDVPSAWRALAVTSDGLYVGGILWKDEIVGGRTENRIVLCDGKTGKILARFDDSGKATASYEAVDFSPDGRLFASTDNSTVHLWEVATRRKLAQLDGHRGDLTSVSFSLNGRRLATSSGDSTCVVWDMGRIVNADRPLANAATTKQILGWWNDLLSAEPSVAYTAIWRLSEPTHKAIPFLAERLRPVTNEQARQVAQYVADLNSEKFATRQKAAQQLEAHGRMAEPALRRALEANPPLETRRRLEHLLSAIDDGPAKGDSLRMLRALTVLEFAATPEATRLLESISQGAEGALLTEEARKSVARIRIRNRSH